jgi:serine/threonine-protein kinase
VPLLKPEERLGSILAGRFRLDAILGKGGMGVVFSGMHTWNNRPVAVKVLLPQYAEDPEIRKRFVREAEAAAALSHPNVVQVLDSGEDEEGDAYLALELLEGESLATRLEREGRLPLEETLSLVVPVLDALAYAHERGVIHRDLKPDNLFLAVDARGRCVPKLLDFGIAKLERDTLSVATQAGTVLGTPQYMSPEQAGTGDPVGAASDVWSMGVVLYRCLTGRLPFAGESVAQLLLQIVGGPEVSIRAGAPDVVPAPIAAVVDRALQRSLDGRYATCAALVEALIDAAREVGLEVERDGAIRAAPPAPTEASSEPSTHATDAEPTDAASEAASEAAPASVPTAVAAPDPVQSSEAVEPTRPAVERPEPLPVGPRALTAPRTRWLAIAAVGVVALIGLGVALSSGASTSTRTILTRPAGAAVTLDGQPAGTTPVRVEVSDGRVRDVRIELEGYWPAHLYVSPSDPEPLSFDLRPREDAPRTVVRRVVTRPSGAAAYVAGQRRGVTPVDVEVSSARSVEVRLELDGHWPERLYVAATDPDTIEVELRPR